MAIALSVVHVYCGAVTPDEDDGEFVTEAPAGGSRITLELNRGQESKPLPLAVRTTGASCYILQIKPGDEQIFISLDGVNWRTDFITIFEVAAKNTLFFIKSIADGAEDYGDTVHSLELSYYAPV